MSKTDQIIQRFFENEQPEAVQRTFFRWLNHPLYSSEKEKSLQAQWDSIDVAADDSTARSYEQVAARLGFSQRKTVRSITIRLMRIAAMFLLPLLSVALTYWYMQNQPVDEWAIVECFVPDGEIREIRLPDQSTVLINSGTTLFYPEHFNGKIRSVYLNGEAKFTVTPDKTKPFIVKTNDMDIQALGTVFDVSSYSENSHTTAALVEGKIKVDLKASEGSFVLNPNEQVIFNKETRTAERKPARIDYVLAWEHGQMVFQSASLATVIREIERHYQVKVYLNSTKLNDKKLTMKFLSDESLEDVLSVLQHIIKGLHYKIEGDKIYIY
jgi:ferric-dicitrate binding protein FerR (iron transport regulator)